MEIVETRVEPGAGEQPSLKIGDTVHYVPDLIHARERDHMGDYPWVIGRKLATRKGDEVEELTSNEAAKFMQEIAANPNKNAKDRLVFVRPRVTWPAKVREVNPDGSVNLDIYARVNHLTGAPITTLLYDKVKLEGTKVVPHTCHTPPATTEGSN